jgi:hypothetical protein
MGRGARFRPPPSGAPSIAKRCPLPVSAKKAIPLAGTQLIVHSMVATTPSVQVLLALGRHGFCMAYQYPTACVFEVPTVAPGLLLQRSNFVPTLR